MKTFLGAKRPDFQTISFLWTKIKVVNSFGRYFEKLIEEKQNYLYILLS